MTTPLPAHLRFSISIFLLFCLPLPFAGTAVAQPFFEDVTEEAILSSKARLIGMGNTAFSDYDNDGRPDLFMTESWGPQYALLRNRGDGRFLDRLPAIEADVSPQWKGSGGLFGDYDNDGDLDIYMPVGRFHPQPDLNLLLRNDRGVFHDVTEAAGLTEGLATDNAIWLDYDRDGYLDLYTGNLPFNMAQRNALYRNNGDGAFTDETQAAGLDLDLNIDGDPDLGTNGGMAAGDFDGDGWPDLYLGVFGSTNWLFLNNGNGSFRDATTSEIDDPGDARGVAVGDIDNDGDLDIFQAAGGRRPEVTFRSLLLQNLDNGEFLDILEGAGLVSLRSVDALGPNFEDIDNDGDLDLLVAEPLAFFLNNGDLIFTEATGQLGIIGPVGGGGGATSADYDLDGFLDVLFGDGERLEGLTSDTFGGLYRNTGNANHWLRVELVGIESNRNGIGARLVATTGDLVQTRELLGGLGISQNELLAHFGLADHTQVDQLEISWPSGQVDRLTDIAADQKIRVFEGRPGFHPIEPTTWSHNLPPSATVGTTLDLDITVQPALFEPQAQITQVTADLSALGGPSDMALVQEDEGVFRLRTQVTLEDATGPRDVRLTIDQETVLGPYWTQLVESLKLEPVTPAQEEVPVYTKGLAEGWRVDAVSNSNWRPFEGAVVSVDPAAQVENRPDEVLGVQSEGSGWNLTFTAPQPLQVNGLETLSFDFLPANLEETTRRLYIWLNDDFYRGFDLFATVPRVPGLNQSIDASNPQWQTVEIPLQVFGLRGPLETIHFAFPDIWSGGINNAIFIDDMRLVTRPTSVFETLNDVQPHAFTLGQNYPNPFNSGTVIRFTLPQPQDVELAVYNTAGQQVTKLAEGFRKAGKYSVNWDGRDQEGQPLATGLYLYRLQAGTKIETRKLLLLR